MVDPQEKEVSLVLLFLAALAFLRAVLPVSVSFAAAANVMAMTVLVLLILAALVLFACFPLFATALVRAGSVMIWHDSFSLLDRLSIIDICHYLHSTTFAAYVNIIQ